MEEENKIEETKEDVLIKTKSEVERIIKQITENGLQTANVELLYKLIDIHKDIENEKYWKEKEEESMYRGRDYFMDDSYNGGRHHLVQLTILFISDILFLARFHPSIKNPAPFQKQCFFHFYLLGF